MAEELKAKIDEQGQIIRKLKAEKAPALTIQDEVNKLLALKEEYQDQTGEEYAPPAAKKEKIQSKSAPAPEGPAREGPSKKELKKLEKNEKKAKAKAEGRKENGDAGDLPASGAAPARPTDSKSSSGSAVCTGHPAPTLFPGNNRTETHAVLAVAKASGVELKRGYGSKSTMFGSPPYLEFPGGHVVTGHDAVMRAIALAHGPQLGANRPVVDEWLEWSRTTFVPVVAAEKPDAQRLIEEMNVLDAGLVKAAAGEGGAAGINGPELTLADFELCRTAKRALTFFGEHEYPLVRSWVSLVLSSEAYSSTEGLVADRGPFGTSDASVLMDPNRGLLSRVGDFFTAALHQAFPEHAGKPGFEEATVDRCAVPTLGDYQCTSSMSVYKALKGTPQAVGKPQDVAQAMIDNLSEAGRQLFSEVTIAGAGYINVRLHASYLKSRVRDVLEYGAQPLAVQKKKVLVDFSSPNIAKEMHVGHLRSTIIGETLCRILEFLGHEVMRVNHVGDWGTQFGMLIMYLREAYPDFMTNPPNISDLTVFYKAAKKRFDDDADFKERARHGVVQLQAGNPESRAIWKLLCDISRVEFQKVYDRLQVRLEEYGESYYNEMIPSVIDELGSKGLLTEDNGATIMWCGGKHTIPLMVRKSDGGFGYDSTDLAAVRYRLLDLQRDWIIYITDAGQATHFHLIFDAARLAGWIDDKRQRVDHVGFGVVQGEDGKRLKTRSGETVRLVDLLDEAVERMTGILKQRMKDGKSTIMLENVPAAAAATGYGAIKYADLKQNPGSDYQFSYDRMLDTRGDTATYLLFTYARFSSIIRKAKDEKGIDVQKLIEKGDDVILEHPTERALALELAQLPDVLKAAVENLMPSKLCVYVYSLSGKGTDFLEACHVLTNPHRLLLVQATVTVMRKCLELLSIAPLDRI